MALYYYEAFSKDAKKISGTMDASSIEEVRKKLHQMNAYPIQIRTAVGESLGLFARFRQVFAGGVTPKQKILFTKQLAVLLRAGVPLLQAMELLIQQFKGRFRTILVQLKDGIKEGESLAAGLANYPNVFDSIYIQLVRAGEASGNLEVILERLVTYMEEREEIATKVRSALRYPLIQLTVVVLVAVALLTFVIPQLAETFEAQGAELPWSTAILINISDFFIDYWWGILSVLIALTLLYMYWKSTPKGARQIDQIKLRIPIVSYFTRMGAIVQFTRTLGMLLQSGVNLSEALDIVVKIVNNRILKDVLNAARDKIVKEGRIAEFLQQTNLFPPVAIYLIRTGEKTGKLDKMLLTVAQEYEKDLGEYADNLSSLIEPIMQIVLAVMVGFVVMAVMGVIQVGPEMFNM